MREVSENESLVLRLEPRCVVTVCVRYCCSVLDALFVPEGWWHQVDSDAYTIAVNFWFDGLRQQLTEMPEMTPYYSRVLLEDLIKRETERYLQNLRQKALVETQSSLEQAGDFTARILRFQHQEDKEAVLIAMDAKGSDEFRSAQLRLASSYPPEWRSLLENASVDFVALLTNSWEAEEEKRADAAGGSSSASADVSALLDAFGDGEHIRSQLLQKKDSFQKKMCAQVVFATFGLSVAL